MVFRAVKVDLSNYATKTDLKIVTQIDTSSFALKRNLANLKTEENKIKYQMLVVLLKKQAITQKLLILKENLILIIMTNILILQILIN